MSVAPLTDRAQIPPNLLKIELFGGAGVEYSTVKTLPLARTDALHASGFTSRREGYA